MAVVIVIWLSILQLFAIVSIVAVAFGLILGRVKPGDALQHVIAILGIVIVLTLIPAIIIGAWSRLMLWQKIGFVAIAALFLLLRQSQRRPRDEHRD